MVIHVINCGNFQIKVLFNTIGYMLITYVNIVHWVNYVSKISKLRLKVTNFLENCESSFFDDLMSFPSELLYLLWSLVDQAHKQTKCPHRSLIIWVQIKHNLTLLSAIKEERNKILFLDITADLVLIAVCYCHYFSLSQPFRLTFLKHQKDNIQAWESPSLQIFQGLCSQVPPTE